VVSVAGIAVLLQSPGEEQPEIRVAAGSGLIAVDAEFSTTLCARMAEEMAAGQEALLDSVAFDGLRYEWPDSIRSIIAVPLLGKDSRDSLLTASGQRGRQPVGVMVAVNVLQKAEFDSTDIKLFNSVANSCAVFVENGRLFNDVSELFVGSLRALTHSIDAKDAYTHGHSERVATVSRWIAEHGAATLELRPEQIQQVYLAGLLHDIGKIGVEDSILRKEGRLTDEEHACIRKHPGIGAGILRGIPQMDAIIPGVLYHHEWVNGQGYPHGLKGDRIPLIGRIVGLADAFDAMTSRRSYRQALDVDAALLEIRKCVGTQFDERVTQVFLESDIDKLWHLLQSESHETHDASGYSECRLAAVGTLIR
jgi:HD-GYP domain-containing protein (c-di-GMP phosphodiesterase class II)